MEDVTLQRCSAFNLLCFFQLEDAWVEVEDFIVDITRGLVWIDKVISDFDDVVAEINVTVG